MGTEGTMASTQPDRSPRRASSPALTRQVAPGIHRLSHASVNCYLIEEGSALTIVDAALPATWQFVKRAIRAIGHTVDDVEAIVLTHAHSDHLGFARHAQREWGVPVFAHPLEGPLAASPSRSAHPRIASLLGHPRAIPAFAAMVRAGGLHVPPVDDLRSFGPGDVLDLPGSPTVVFSPGHTPGHCALLVRDASALLCGDALVTADPLTGRTGPQLAPGADTGLDTGTALRSLAALAGTGASIVLPGHGEPWRDGVRLAVGLAAAAGPPLSARAGNRRQALPLADQLCLESNDGRRTTE